MELINKIKKEGKRITEPREIVCNILEKSGHKHFTAEELFKKAKKVNSSIDLTTVYRTLDLLEELNLIEHSHRIHQSGIYFIKHTKHHVHLSCESCGEIVNINQKTQKQIEKLLLNESNFKNINSHFTYSGHCNKCK
ncbi:MAG: Fur family transcriptional regulator [Actinomycetota bacterium]|nr:Fur family transcriptional regulator [Actinomycetota bacterium]MDA3013698.1 Fur family transcriptional regulator [Actinomycetota bacterium]